MKSLLTLTVLISVIYWPVSYARDFSWIIGGGPDKSSSQVQIERNVIWAREVISRQSKDPAIKVYYTDGSDPTPDVVDYLERDLTDNQYLLDMVFGGPDAFRTVYRNHGISEHSGSTHPDSLIPDMEQDFEALQANDSALILYNGHGLGDYTDFGLNNLRLWTEQRLTVYDFEEMLGKLNEKAPVRFIFTQCYSGGFARLIHPGASGNTMDLKGNRCGFTAELETRESEGCSSSLKIGQYRDYTTFMFAALDGKTRQNRPLESDPDLNGDSKTSLREAHLYALANAYSNDLSRSTSEYYLEKWEPWYLRWIPKDERSKQSIFNTIRSTVLENNDLSNSLSESPSELRAEKVKKLKYLEQIESDFESLRKEIEALQASLIFELQKRFPDIQTAYKHRFTGIAENEIEKLITAIKSLKGLSVLEQKFAQKDNLDLVLLDAERAFTQIEKIERLDKLSKLESLFSEFASDQNSSNLNRIINCEETYL